MSNKLFIFDLDGVLIDTKEMHYKCLNDAISQISPDCIITESEHLFVYDGLSTNDKLNLLSKNKNLNIKHHKKIWQLKQLYTIKQIDNISPNHKLIEIFSYLKDSNYLVACCSNSIRKTLYKILHKLDIIDYFDLLISNEDVRHPKPHPEMYWKAMANFGLNPEDTFIFEDSPNGLLAAQTSGANVIRVKNSKDLNIDKVKEFNSIKNKDMKWQDKNLNVLIPMAGAGSRFEKAGYTFPKPLIEVNGKPMIQTVVDNLAVEANYIFIVQKQHRNKYNLDSVLNLIAPNCKIVEVDGLTEGAACTTLIAEEYINNDNPLLMANSDQFVEWSSSKFMYKMQEQNLDGGILTFNSTHPKWSYAKINENNLVTQVAEKNPISDNATVGIYFWKKGSDYVKYAKQMISKNIRTNNEFYVCPVFNEAIQDGKKISIHNIEKMWGLGTPEDLDIFLKNKCN